MPDICISGGALAVIGSLLTAMAGAIGVLWRELLRSKNEQIQELQDIAKGALNVGEGTIEVSRAAARQKRGGMR